MYLQKNSASLKTQFLAGAQMSRNEVCLRFLLCQPNKDLLAHVFKQRHTAA